MSPYLTGVIIAAGVIVLLAILLAGIYNRLVTLRQRYLNAWAQIDVQLKRRHDLIPNLVESVKGYMAHERQTLEAVIAARNAAANAVAAASSDPRSAAAVRAAAGAESQLVGALGRLFALSESYPDLKADRSVGLLIEELTSTENRVAFARQAYNDAVMQFNTARATFPSVVFASSFGFTAAAFFEIEKVEERQNVNVSFDRAAAK